MATSTSKEEQRLLESLKEKNRRLQKKVDALTYKCTMQSKILTTGNFSNLQVYIDQLMAYLNSNLKKIEVELNLSENSAKDTDELCRLREFLLSHYTQLGRYLVLAEGLIHVDMRRLQDKHSEIGYAIAQLYGLPHDVMSEILDEQDRLLEHILQFLERKEKGEKDLEKGQSS